MRAFLIALTAALTLFAAGCGGDDEPKKPTAAQAAVLATVTSANAAFEKGDYAKTCTYYDVELMVQLITSTQAQNCIGAWKVVDALLKQSFPDAKMRKARVTFAPESATIKGDAAIATFGKPPAILEKALPKAKGQKMLLRKAGGRWIIASLPQFG